MHTQAQANAIAGRRSKDEPEQSRSKSDRELYQEMKDLEERPHLLE